MSRSQSTVYYSTTSAAAYYSQPAHASQPLYSDYSKSSYSAQSSYTAPRYAPGQTPGAPMIPREPTPDLDPAPAGMFSNYSSYYGK